MGIVAYRTDAERWMMLRDATADNVEDIFFFGNLVVSEGADTVCVGLQRPRAAPISFEDDDI